MSNSSKILFIDVETSGYDLHNMLDRSGNGKFQMVSLGAIVASANTLKELDQFYIEFKYMPECVWAPEAERIHKLSKEYLEENGVDYQDGFVELTKFLIKHYDPSRSITLGGHNVSTFDRHFLIQLFNHNDAAIQLSGQCVDSYTLGKVLLNANNSNELFEQVGISRDAHNALEDARASLKAARLVKKLYETALNTQLS